MRKSSLFTISLACMFYAGSVFAGAWQEPRDVISLPNDCPVIDKTSYKVISGSYGKDKNGIYYGCDRVNVKNPKTFSVFKYKKPNSDRSYYAKDSSTVYMGSIPLAGVDVTTFRYFSGPMIAKDKKNLFCASERFEGVKGKNIIVKNRSISDGKRIFLRGDGLCFEIPGVHASTWKEINIGDAAQSFSKDKNNIYFGTEKLIGVDKKTWGIIQGTNDSYSKDKNSVYFEARKIEGADSATFHFDKEKDVFMDKNGVYTDGRLKK